MQEPTSYDYVFLGAGCASLSLLMRMLKHKEFQQKKIWLIDKAPKNKNDRTWCFWETNPGFFEEIVYKNWNTVSFKSQDFTADMNIAPYQYKMIKGIDFYNYCFEKIKEHSNVSITYANVDGLCQSKDGIALTIDAVEIALGNATVFNTIYKERESVTTIKLLQHFKGWIIETKEKIFNPLVATMMDFTISQHKGTAFVYVMPFSATKALVEYTLFTKELLQVEEYNESLRNYIESNLGVKQYNILEEEFGIIPMTNQRFSFYQNGVYNLGMAGGQTKASSGYTFQFIQKQSKQILDYLLVGKSLKRMSGTAPRFRFYDNTLLHILYHDQLPGSKIFARLFKKNKPQQILKFLDSETTLAKELRIISTLPTWPFLKAAMRQFHNYYSSNNLKK